MKWVLRLCVLATLLAQPVSSYGQSPDEDAPEPQKQSATTAADESPDAGNSDSAAAVVPPDLSGSIVRAFVDAPYTPVGGLPPMYGIVISQVEERALIYVTLGISGPNNKHLHVGARFHVSPDRLSTGAESARHPATPATCVYCVPNGNTLVLQVDKPDSHLKSVKIAMRLPPAGMEVYGAMTSADHHWGVQSMEVSQPAEWNAQRTAMCQAPHIDEELIALFNAEGECIGLPAYWGFLAPPPNTIRFQPVLDIVDPMVEHGAAFPDPLVQAARARRVKVQDTLDRPVTAEGITVSWSDDHTELHGFSQTTGKWSILSITPQSIIEPAIMGDIAVVQLENALAAFSGKTGHWDLLDLPMLKKDAWQLSAHGLRVTGLPGNYVFSAVAGQWTSPSDPEFRPGELRVKVAPEDAARIANRVMGADDLPSGVEVDLTSDHGELILKADQKRKLKRVFVSEEFAGSEAFDALKLADHEAPDGQSLEMREFVFPKGRQHEFVERFNAAVLLKNAEGLSVIPHDDRLQVFGTHEQLLSVADQVLELTQTTGDRIAPVGAEEKKPLELAGRLRAVEAVSDVQRAELRKLVADALEVRLTKQKLQVEQLTAKLKKVENAWNRRQQARERIIDRRVEELLDPAVDWETIVASAGSRPAIVPYAQEGHNAVPVLDYSPSDRAELEAQRRVLELDLEEALIRRRFATADLEQKRRQNESAETEVFSKQDLLKAKATADLAEVGVRRVKERLEEISTQLQEPATSADDDSEGKSVQVRDNVASEDGVRLLVFTAAYCQPCQKMAPVIERMKKDGFSLEVLDITRDAAIARRYKVERIPTMVLIVGDQEVRRFTGITEEEELRQATKLAARRLKTKARLEERIRR